MVFVINGKVAIVTGGAGGIGLDIAKELLKNGAKGVTIVDIDDDSKDKVLEEIGTAFGDNKAIYVTADVRDIDQFEEVYKRTLEAFKHVDILVNNAGILNDHEWNKEIDINLKGTINGVLLGLEKYLQTNRSGNEAVIVNLSSVAGVQGMGFIPVYTSTKFAIHGLTLAWGTQPHYRRTGVKVVAICPGATTTNLLASMENKNLGPPYEEHRIKYESDFVEQTAEQCAVGTIKVIENAETGTVWIIEAGEAPYQFVLPDRNQLKEKKYITN